MCSRSLNLPKSCCNLLRTASISCDDRIVSARDDVVAECTKVLRKCILEEKSEKTGQLKASGLTRLVIVGEDFRNIERNTVKTYFKASRKDTESVIEKPKIITPRIFESAEKRSLKSFFPIRERNEGVSPILEPCTKRRRSAPKAPTNPNYTQPNSSVQNTESIDEFFGV